MYIKNKGTLFQLNQVKGPPAMGLPKRGYSNKAQPQAFATMNHNHAKKQQALGKVSKYCEPWLDLNNWEIIEFEIVEVCRHKHPLAENPDVG